MIRFPWKTPGADPDRPARSRQSNLRNAAWAVLVIAYVFGYYAWSDPYDQADADYVISGAVAAVLFAWAAYTVPTGFATLGLIAASWEAAQKAICGVTFYGPSAEPLCIAQYGHMPYFALALASSLYLWMRRWDLKKMSARWSRAARSFRRLPSSKTSGPSRSGRSEGE